MLTIGTAVIRPESALVSSSFMKRTTAAIDEYSPPWMPAIRQRCGPSAAPRASKHGSSSSASTSVLEADRAPLDQPAWPSSSTSGTWLGGLLAPGEVAGGEVVRRRGPRERRILGRAERLLRDRAARVEAAAARQRRSGSAGRRRPRAPSSARCGASRGTARSRPCVYGCRGFANSSSVGAVSTIRPRYMTATRSQTWRTTAMLCAIRRIVSPSFARRSSSRLSTVACTETSSAETGSSATSSSGSSASARAMLTRWRWPPENCRGWASSARGPSPTSSSSSRQRRVEPLRRHHLVHPQQLARASAGRSCAG